MDRRELLRMVGAGGVLSALAGLQEAAAGTTQIANTYTADGVGAVPRALGNKLNDFVSVRDFGAVGDGHADDTEAFLQAIAQSTHAVFVPKGMYKINRTLFLPSHTHMQGTGGRSFIVRDTSVAPFDILEIKGTSHITIDDITIDGLEKLDITVPANRYSGIRVWRGNGGDCPTDITIRNVRIDRTTNGEVQSEGNRGALTLEDCYDVRVHGFKGWNNRGTSILLWGKSAQIVISDSWLSGEVAPFSTTFNAGKPIGSGISGCYRRDVIISGCLAFNHGYTNISVSGTQGVVSGNICYGSRYAGITIGHNSHGSEAHDTVCLGNLVYDNVLDGIYCANSSNVVIADNIIRNNGRGAKRCGIRLMWDGSKIIGNKNVTIMGNKIFRNEASGILVEWGTDHLISDNVIYENGSAGVYLNGKAIEDGSDLDQCVVKGNYIRDNSTGGVVVSGNVVRSLVVVAKDNIIATVDPADRQQYGIWSTKNSILQVEGNLFSSNYDGTSSFKINSAMRSSSGGKFYRIKNFKSYGGNPKLKYIHADN